MRATAQGLNLNRSAASLDDRIIIINAIAVGPWPTFGPMAILLRKFKPNRKLASEYSSILGNADAISIAVSVLTGVRQQMVAGGRKLSPIQLRRVTSKQESYACPNQNHKQFQTDLFRSKIEILPNAKRHA